MGSCRAVRFIAAAVLALAVTPAGATATHDYASDEYAIIHDGMAPNKRLSLAAHGEGTGGADNFHLWLMAEPAHDKIMALEGVSDNNLDTGPNAYHAQWTADSRRVAVLFRSDRRVVQLNLYKVEADRAHLISGPSLFRAVTSRDVGDRDDMLRSSPELDWKGPDRFVLREYRLFKPSGAGFVRMMGRYGRTTDRFNGGMSMVEFSAEADCVLISGNRYRIVALRVGKFPE